MSANRDALRLLFPIDLGGDFAASLDIDAGQLDLAQTSAETLLSEMHPDTADALLADWERVYGIAQASDTPVQFRRAEVVRRIRARGGLSIPYFLGLAQSLGYDVEIVEPVPTMAGWAGAGDELIGLAAISQWGLVIHNQPTYLFRAGESAAGESLLWWQSQDFLEQLVVELKPAHTQVYFSYTT